METVIGWAEDLLADGDVDAPEEGEPRGAWAVRVLEDRGYVTAASERPRIMSAPTRMAYQPRTARGRRLLAIRQRIVQSGAPLLSLDEVNREGGE
jgi:hypothetical protein